MKRTFFALILIAGIGRIVAFSLFSMEKDLYAAETGELSLKAPPRNLAMGGAGAALSDSLNVNSMNPATYARLDYTLVTLTYAPEFTSLSDNDTGAGFKHFGSDFPSAELDIPLGRYGVFFGGYHRDRVLAYDVTYVDADGYTVRRSGSGGTYNAFAGYAYSVNRMISAGASFNALFGKTTTNQAIIERPADGALLEPSRLQRSRFQAYSAEAGVILKRGAAALGLSAVLPVGSQSIRREHQIIQKYSASDSVVTFQEYDDDSRFLAPSLTIGLAYMPIRPLQLVSDGLLIFWNDHPRALEYRVGLGAEVNLASRPGDSYLLDIPLRAGAYYHCPGYPDNVTEQAVTVGFGLPTYRGFGLLNFSAEFGTRSSDGGASGLTESFSKLSVQLVHKSRWGRLRRESNSGGRRPDGLQ